MGAHLSFTLSGLDEAISKMDALAAIQPADVLDPVGALIVIQTQTRIMSEKASPSGESWKPNLMGTSTLFRSGNLASTLTHQVRGATVSVGSNLVYAAIHNFGGTIKASKKKALRFPGQARQDIRLRRSITMPKREYLGVSPANGQEIEKMVAEHYAEVFK